MNINIPQKHHLPIAYLIMLFILMYGPVFGCQHYSGAWYFRWVACMLLSWVGWVLVIMSITWFFNKVDDKKETE